MVRKIVLAAALALVSMAALAQSMVNINTASADELAQMLDGVGEVKARAIVEYREANGGFTSVAGLVDVDGIGEATLESNRASLTVGTQ